MSYKFLSFPFLFTLSLLLTHTGSCDISPRLAFLPIQGQEGNILTQHLIEALSGYEAFALAPYSSFENSDACTQEHDKFGNSLDFTHFFTSHDYLLVAQIVHTQCTPLVQGQYPNLSPRKIFGKPYVVSLGVRFRLIDMQSKQPRIVAQEYVEKQRVFGSRDGRIKNTQLFENQALEKNIASHHIIFCAAEHIAHQVNQAIE